MDKFGQNLGYIDELYRSFLADPESVSEAWRDFFADWRATAAPKPVPPTARVEPRIAVPTETPRGEPLRGIQARIAENMTASLEVPTATSARTIAVKMLEENRRIINLHQDRVAGPRISFTHLIAWAIVRAVEAHPAINASYESRDGVPHRIPHEEVNLGLAVDLQKGDDRVLLVPNIKNAGALDFPSFVAALDDLVVRSRKGQLEVADFQDTTITLTNPGMLGTALSVPRLMQGQGAIIGAGSIGYPAEYGGMAPEVISELGLSKVMTVTSTYDHRVIQGADSGGFLATLDRRLQGDDGLFERVFEELGIPHEPIRWAEDRNPRILSNSGAEEAVAKQAGVLQLIRAYRVRGHLWADLDPLGYNPEPHPELELSYYGLSVWDLDRKFICGGLGGCSGMLTLREIVYTLQETYCRHIGIEYMHIQDREPRQWLQERSEHLDGPPPVPRDRQIRILKRLNTAEAFEAFIGTNYVGQKRFSLEGAESLVPMLDAMLSDAAADGMEELVIGMAHRGRLNVLANVVGKSYGQIFGEFEGDMDPRTIHGSGDVKYHLGASGTIDGADGRHLRISVASNPSHLEAVDPVVEGMVRALQDRIDDSERARVLPVLIHGDAAFAGQGVVAETLNLSQLMGYRTGGTVHLVIDNKIGFTTGPTSARSSKYPTDVAKMLGSPIFHVNGDHPEEAVRIIRLAFAFRQTFKRDVVVDLVCYRRWGHNEGDDPSYTHPTLYSKIQQHRSVRKLYTEQLVRRGDFDMQTAEEALEHFRKELQQVHDEVRQVRRESDSTEPVACLESVKGAAWNPPATAVPLETLASVMQGLERTPEGFEVHPKLARQLEQRRKRFEQDRIDWALAESLSFGSLVLAGTAVRLSGEDSGRGTFSQRHAVLYDYRTAAGYTPLDHLSEDQARFQVFDSLLSEFAVLGFEYGYSVNQTGALVLWEAQFGDFVNGAQVILDQFISSAEEKWGQTSGVTLLLPHGYEGQGPEHSSARFERFLQLAALGNLRLAYPSTPAQYFHLLRAQATDPSRKPLVVLTPKSLLRNRECVSRQAEFRAGGFESTLRDPKRPDLKSIDRLVFTSGKVYYDLDAFRSAEPFDHVAVCRIEQLYPFPVDAVSRLMSEAGPQCEVVWVQEEPRNMGGWSYVSDRIREMPGGRQSLRYVGRPRSSSTATGSHRHHLAEQQALVEQAFNSGGD
jgi:2-oxoglutarate decarboxylase